MGERERPQSRVGRGDQRLVDRLGGGADDTLDPALVAHVWENIAPAAPLLASSGRFGEGASGTVDDDASLQTKLLDATGRRP